MKVIKPVPITDAQFVSSTVLENDYPALVSTTDYAVAARVISGHVIYESLQTPNLNKPPANNPLHWVVVGPTNRWAMFDNEISTQTVGAGSIEVVIKPGYVTGIAFFGLQGSSLSITVRDGAAGPIVFSKTKNLDGTIILDWAQYFFEEAYQLEEYVAVELPPYANAHITVTISGTTAKCGILAVGQVYKLGRTLRGATAGLIDYSRKETSASGVTTFKKRRNSKRMSAPVLVERKQFNKLQQLLAKLLSVPCVWIGSDDPSYLPLTVFGFFRDGPIVVEYADHLMLNIDIEGLT